MSGKVKIKELKKVVGDVNLNGMFEEMMGVKDAEADIIIPKFVFVRNTLRHIYRVFQQFSTFGPLRTDFPAIGDALDEIKKYSEDMKESAYLKHDHEEKETAYQSISKEDINGLWRKLKDNQYVKSMVVLCSRLGKYKSNFEDSNALKENFVNQEPGLSFILFDFSTLDLKMLWADTRMKSPVKKYILAVLGSLYKHTHALYKCVTSPDVDVEKFTEVLMSSIAELKKQPKLHRCQTAFRRIEQSVELLHDKFDDYYRESVASENADMLVMSFIVDVSNQGGASATLTREFRTIIQYMHEISQKSGKNKDPNVQKIFKMLNQNFAMMEKTTGVKPTKDEPVDMDSLDLSTRDEAGTPLTEEQIAEEKHAKRMEKQKAKKKKKAAKKKSKAEDVVEEEVVAEETAVAEEAAEEVVEDSTVAPETVADETEGTAENSRSITVNQSIEESDADE